MGNHKVVFIRHGKSEWNLQNRFTGWTDVPLSEHGHAEARHAGQLLREQGFLFDVAYTSFLKRAIRTLWYVLEELDLMWIPVFPEWRLNERHYGALEGLDKSETAEKYGDEQVQLWRRSYSVQPPALTKSDDRYPGNNPRYRNLLDGQIPLTESLHDTVNRVVPLWKERIAPDIRSGKNVIIAAHNNSLRALIKYLDGVSDSEIVRLSIPTGIPLVYEFDENLKPIQHYYTSDEETMREAVEAIAARGRMIP